jgi:hypothetical protein
MWTVVWTNQPYIFINIQELYHLSRMTKLTTRQLFFLLILSAILIIPPVSSFIVENPTARINPVGDHFVGDKFTITGSTNLAVGDDLLVEIYSSSFKPTQKAQSGEFSGSGGTVTVVPGTNGYNTWSFDVDTSTFKPDEYILKVSGTTIEVTGSATFNILEPLPPTSLPTVEKQATTLQTVLPITTTPSPLPTTTNKSPLSPATILVAFALVGCAMVLKRK